MRARTAMALLASGAAAVAAKRALARRVERSPLWPLPALDEPVSGTMGQRRTGPSRARVLTVLDRAEPADGVVRLRLGGAGTLPSWQPGAHVDLVLPSGLVRQYSLCGDPGEADTYTIATRLTEDSRGGSREVHEVLREGVQVEVRGPRNRFPLVEAPAYLFVAGGIGITPVLPMVRAAEAAGTPWRLLYGGRTRASMPFLDELAELDGLDGGAGRVTVVPQDEAGHPDLAGALAGIPPEAAVYCCGPEPLMDAVTALPAPRGGVHLERFSAARTPSPSGDDREFEAELRRSGGTVTVPAGTPALAAIRAAYPDTPYSCEQGFCGTCQTGVLEGEVDHRDELLTDAERDTSMLLCVSRARGKRVVLDL
ncbi:PDR/VanB family oxidoreductase [Streptomyces sp. NPDC048172]|uniref:PDR/VanB family oxidoreductase n=1 Tax=Streptomyces sp. NPDC048172 TaxID=3365505 RepID=UPI003711086A